MICIGTVGIVLISNSVIINIRKNIFNIVLPEILQADSIDKPSLFNWNILKKLFWYFALKIPEIVIVLK